MKQMIRWLAILVVLPTFASVADEETDDQPASFRRDIVPILVNRCLTCHSGSDPKGELDLTQRDRMLTGGTSGPAIKPGDAAGSLLLQLVKGQDEDRVMPAQGARLTDNQLAHLVSWIDAGAPWDEGLVLKGLRQAPLAPRQVQLPAARPRQGITNPIDRILLASARGTLPPLVNDRVFMRRLFMDLLGIMPTIAEVRAFEADQDVQKRQTLVQEALGRNKEYAEHWLTFWNDALRNAYQGTGFIDNGRSQITPWLSQALYQNKPYDRFVHELISPTPESQGFVKGITWRGVVNASQRREMQAAQNIAQVFLGTNLKCASCHDSFVNHWKLTESHALAAVFADGPFEVFRCNKATGQTVQAAFLYPELGQIDSTAPRATRMKQLADIVTSRDNGRLSRTIVNRLWAWTMGRGIVEPLDDMDQTPWNEDLLDWLAWNLAENKFDLKQTLLVICTSRAYQLPSVGQDSMETGQFVFHGPQVKRLTAEQFVDAVNRVTHAWPSTPIVQGLPLTSAPGGQHALSIAPRWIWDSKQFQLDMGGRLFCRTSLSLEQLPDRAIAVTSCDNEFSLLVNKRLAGQGKDWSTPSATNILPFLKKGANVVAIEAINWPDKATGKGLQIKAANPGGLISGIYLGFSSKQQGEQAAYRWESYETGADWLVTREVRMDWADQEFVLEGWKPAVDLGPGELEPWKLADRFALAATKAADRAELLGHLRNSLINDDPLTRALGRPNREQVITRRSSVATTLQAIELTNGETLDQGLKRGASYWNERVPQDNRNLVRLLYEASLQRVPSEAEQKIALSLLDGGKRLEGIEDLLWILAMVPEFQLVY